MESKGIYEHIKEYILSKYGFKVSTLYIAQIKRKCGLELGDNYNKSKKENSKIPECPKEKEDAIMDVWRHLKKLLGNLNTFNTVLLLPRLMAK